MPALPRRALLAAAAAFAPDAQPRRSSAAGRPAADGRLREVAAFAQRPTGVAVSRDGRVFVSLPFAEYSDPARFAGSLVEVLPDGSARPYPDAAWNANPVEAGAADPGRRFLNVQSHTIDAAGVLWALDRGRPRGGEVVPGGAKLVGIDLAAGRAVRVIAFDGAFARGNFLNDVRVDAAAGAAYVTETARGGVLAVDLTTGRQRRALHAGDWVRYAERRLVAQGVEIPEPRRRATPRTADGLALGPDGVWLYLQSHPWVGADLHRVPTAALRDEALAPDRVAARVERVAEAVPSDGIQTDARGRVYFTDYGREAIGRWDPAAPGRGVEVVVSDPRISWPDAIDFGPDGSLFFTVAQFHRAPALNGGVERAEPPFRVFRLPGVADPR